MAKARDGGAAAAAACGAEGAAQDGATIQQASPTNSFVIALRTDHCFLSHILST
jgi:hypothetical protein